MRDKFHPCDRCKKHDLTECFDCPLGADNHGKECAHYDCFFNTGEFGCSLHFDLTCRVSTVYEPEDNDDDEIIDKLSEMYGGEKS